MEEDYNPDILKTIELLSTLSDEEVEHVRERAVIKKFLKNETILHEEDTNEFLYMILSGSVKVVQTTQDGKEMVLAMHRSRDFFGEMSLLDGKTVPATVVAMEDSVVARMKAHDFIALIRSDFDLTLRLLRILTGKARGLSDRIFDLIAHNARDRICFELARLAATGVRDGSRVMIRPAPTHYEIAARIGEN